MNRDEKILTIIELCKDIDIDGETMEYILEKVAMTDQMLRQLVMNNPQSNIIDLLNEKIELDAELYNESYELMLYLINKKKRYDTDKRF